MAVNVELLDKVLAHIEANTHLWNQGVWSTLNINGYSGDELRQMVLEDPYNPACGAAHCFAGHVVVSQGWRLLYLITDYHSGEVEVYADFCTKRGARQPRGIGEKARELLRLTQHDANALFKSDNTLEQLREMVQKLKRGEHLHNDHCDAWDCVVCGE